MMVMMIIQEESEGKVLMVVVVIIQVAVVVAVVVMVVYCEEFVECLLFHVPVLPVTVMSQDGDGVLHLIPSKHWKHPNTCMN